MTDLLGGVTYVSCSVVLPALRHLTNSMDCESEDEEVPNKALCRYRAEPTIGEKDCPLKWWFNHAGANPLLSALACKYLGSPATPVPCERLFSLAGHIVQKKRASLSSEKVHKLVSLSNWKEKKKKA